MQLALLLDDLERDTPIDTCSGGWHQHKGGRNAPKLQKCINTDRLFKFRKESDDLNLIYNKINRAVFYADDEAVCIIKEHLKDGKFQSDILEYLMNPTREVF